MSNQFGISGRASSMQMHENIWYRCTSMLAVRLSGPIRRGQRGAAISGPLFGCDRVTNLISIQI